MLDIRLFRIDDRLIHGQIISAWISALEVNTIVVADDKVVKDELQKMMLRMATPSNIRLKILGVKDAAPYLSDEKNNGRVLVLVKGVEQILMLVKEGVSVKSINIGNMSMDPKKKKIYKSIWVGDEDIKHLEELNSMGIELEVRVIPDDKRIPMFSLIK